MTGERERLRLISYNLHEFIGRDARLAPDLIRRALDRLDADVIALQEFHALRSDISSLQSLGAWGRSLEMTAVAGFTLQRAGGHYGSALLTRLPVKSVQRHDLSIPGLEPRGAIDARLDWHGAELRLLTTHLGVRWRERRLQIRQLLQLLDAGEEDEGEPIPTLLLGDLNDWTPGSLQTRPLWRRLPHRTRAKTFPARCPLLALDRIAASSEIRWLGSRVERSEPFPTASDHLPLIAEIALERD